MEECMQTYGNQYLDAVRNADYTPYGGENADKMSERVASFMREMEGYAEGLGRNGKVAVVCHFGTIYHVLCYVLGFRFPKSAVSIQNTSISKFSYFDGRWKLISWNSSAS
jgi:broad specificity phosphatase PhoE